MAVAPIALVGIALALALLWSLVTGLLQLPLPPDLRVAGATPSRGYQAVSRGMVAVGAGDTIAARRYANEAERLLDEKPLTLLLKAQAAQVSGNREAAEAAFTQMMDEDETRVLGLRGLFVEARRRGDGDAGAQQYPSKPSVSPRLPPGRAMRCSKRAVPTAIGVAPWSRSSGGPPSACSTRRPPGAIAPCC